MLDLQVDLQVANKENVLLVIESKTKKLASQLNKVPIVSMTSMWTNEALEIEMDVIEKRHMF